jgi:hypothetical protein
MIGAMLKLSGSTNGVRSASYGIRLQSTGRRVLAANRIVRVITADRYKAHRGVPLVLGRVTTPGIVGEGFDFGTKTLGIEPNRQLHERLSELHAVTNFDADGPAKQQH